MIKSLAVALMLSGTVAVLPQIAIAQTQVSGLENVPKSEFVTVQKAYSKTSNTKDGAPSFDKFISLMHKRIAYQKSQLVVTNEDPAQVEKFQKMVDAFNKVTLGNRNNNRTEINNGMTAFINLL